MKTIKREIDKIMLSIAENPKTQKSMLDKLSINWSKDVRIAVVNNPNTPPKTILKMIKDKDKTVRKYANDNIHQKLIWLQNE